MQKIGTNPPPTYPKPKPPPAPPRVDKGYEGMTNAEVYGSLALILIELQKINAKLDTTYDEGDPTQYDIEFPTLLKGEE